VADLEGFDEYSAVVGFVDGWVGPARVFDVVAVAE